MKNRTILIVDDEADIRDTLKDVFELEGWLVELAANGREALAMLARVTPAVIVLDLMMPVMDGYAFYAALQADPAYARLPVLISTSDASRAPAGPPVVKKPVDIDTLIATITRLAA